MVFGVFIYKYRMRGTLSMTKFENAGVSQKIISLMADVNISTVGRWIKRSNLDNSALSKERVRHSRYSVADVRKILSENYKQSLQNKDVVMSFYNFKGGTGKTSLCYQVSTHLALFGYNVLVIDADPQGHLSTSLGFDNNHDYPTICDVVNGTIPIRSAIREVFPGLSCIPSNLSLTRLEVFLTSATKREEIILNHIEKLSGQYDFIIFDTNPTISLLNRNILVASDLISIVCETQPYSLNGLKILMEDMNIFFQNMRLNFPDVMVIPNKYEDRSSNSAESMTVLRQYYADFMVKDFAVRKSEDIPTSAKQSLPLAFFARSNSIALEDILDLTREIVKKFSINIAEEVIA
jgi:chromosome partitioning protein